MRKLFFLLILFLIYSSTVPAQEKKNRYQFRSVHSIALVNGSNSVSAALQSIAGISRGKWFAGAGAGLDYYLYRTIPVFIDTRFEWGKNKNKYFLYADGGISFSWVEDGQIENPGIWNGNRSNQFQNGIYTDAGIGYTIGMKNTEAFVMSLGFSHKKLKETISYEDWRTRELQTDIHSYGLNRILIKAGWRF